MQNSNSGDGVQANPKVSDVAYIRDTYFSTVYALANQSMTSNTAPMDTLRGKHLSASVCATEQAALVSAASSAGCRCRGFKSVISVISGQLASIYMHHEFLQWSHVIVGSGMKIQEWLIVGLV